VQANRKLESKDSKNKYFKKVLFIVILLFFEILLIIHRNAVKRAVDVIGPGTESKFRAEPQAVGTAAQYRYSHYALIEPPAIVRVGKEN
jgi:hypothetical protein